MDKKLVVYNVRIPADVKSALAVRARSLGVGASALARAALTAVATTPVSVKTVTKADKSG